MNKPEVKDEVAMSLEDFLRFVEQEQDKNWEEDIKWDKEHPYDDED